MSRHPPTPPLFPSPPPSPPPATPALASPRGAHRRRSTASLRRRQALPPRSTNSSRHRSCAPTEHLAQVVARSEEHTSELQSHLNLVCRLLLEKKKKTCNNID